MDQMIRTTLEEVQQLCECNADCKAELQGRIIKMTLLNGNETVCYITNYFILAGVPIDDSEEVDYVLSFTINTYVVSSVAHYTHLLSLYFQDDLVIMEDNFIDTHTKEIVFGDDAYAKFEEHTHHKRGFIKCPVCERFVPKDIMISEKGYCKICEEVEIPSFTFH